MKKILFILSFVSLISLSGCYSCKTWQELQGKKPADPNVQFMWEENCRAAPMPLAEKCPLAASLPSAIPPLPNLNTAERIYPCSGCGIVKLQKTMPASVQTGVEFGFKIRVTNLTNFAIADVIVTDMLGANFQYKSSNPPAIIRGKTLVWSFPALPAGETKEIDGIGIASAGGVVQDCTNVSYTMPLCMQTISALPVIAVETIAPAEVSICDTINYIIKVENTGTGPAANVKVIDELPGGLLTPQGSARVEIPIGDVPAGTAKNITVSANAYRTGSYTNYAVTVADGNINASSPAITTVVQQPALNIVQRGPEKQYLGREMTYEIDLTNTGDLPALNTVIENQIPARVSFVRADGGGVLVEDKIIWKISKLNPGDAAKVSVTYMPIRAGLVANIVKASAACADTAGSVFQTHINGN